MDIEHYRRQYGDQIAANYLKLIESPISQQLDEPGIICPHCGHDKTHVYRVQAISGGKKRWRACLKCDQRCTTTESVTPLDYEQNFLRLAKLERFLQSVQDGLDRLLD